MNRNVLNCGYACIDRRRFIILFYSLDKLLHFEKTATKWGTGSKIGFKLLHFWLPAKFHEGIGQMSNWIYKVQPRSQHLI